MTSARLAAQRAKAAAYQAAEAATLTTVTAEGDFAQADQVVTTVEQVETDATNRHHQAETEGFPKDSA